MAGAIIGSATWNQGIDNGYTLGVTVNGNCNLKCGHCYLPRERSAGVISDELIRACADSGFDRLAIVGMEPLLNKSVARQTLKLLEQSQEKFQILGFITNGLNLGSYAKELAALGVDYVDVSFDGGPSMYQARRGVPFDKVRRGVESALEEDLTVHALHTLYGENVSEESLVDMYALGNILGESGKQFFSPYVFVKGREVQSADLSHVLQTLVSSGFNSHETAHFLLDELNVRQYVGGIRCSEVQTLFQECGIDMKKVDLAPLEKMDNVLRVTWDGLCLHPLDTLDTKTYSLTGLKVTSQISLFDLRSKLLGRRCL
ncbi:MAG: radical SAM protein [Candidatus Woesearchaeota archaeon]|nr:MAG: radical SAM protein [Candidatus Woesearchaeota archaeon]